MPLATTRLALHRLAEQVIAPLRVQETGNEIALQPRPGGFGTPDLPQGGWVGVSNTDVVRADGAREPISTLAAAAAFVGLRADGLPTEQLRIDAADVATLAEVWRRGDELLRALADEQPVLWPEHFDIAIEVDEATYGVSPGDDDHPDPYAYVAPWNAPPADPFWNATAFTGAETADLAAALELWRAARQKLA